MNPRRVLAGIATEGANLLHVSCRGLLVVASLFVGLAMPAHAEVYPGVKPFGASAETSLRVDAHTGYLATFTLLREVTPEASRLELISSVYLCDTNALSCRQMAEQTDALPASALAVSADGRSVVLRARWAGASLSIIWSRRGTYSSGQLLVVSSPDGLHHQTWGGGYTMDRASVSTRLFGRACRAPGWLYAAEAGAAEDYGISGHSQVGRVDALRAKLTATKGRCFNPQ